MELAKTSRCRQKHGTVLVRAGNVVGIGSNRDRNFPRILGEAHLKTGNTSYHSEISALRSARRTTRSSSKCHFVVYIARVNKKGEPMYSRPCDACHKQLLKAGVTRVVYTVGKL